MDSVNNNQFEVVPTIKSKRKIVAPCPNVYLNPALDLLANEDPICNTAMEIVPKKRKRTRSCDVAAAFENSALDLGISKTAVNEFLVRELQNVQKNVRTYDASAENIVTTGNVDESFDITIEDNVSHSVKESENVHDINNGVNNEPENVNDHAETTFPTDLHDITDLVPQNEAYNITGIPKMDVTNLDSFCMNDTTAPEGMSLNATEPFYANLTEIDEARNLDIKNQQTNTLAFPDVSAIEMDSGFSIHEQKNCNVIEKFHSPTIHTTNIQTNVTNQVFINNTSNINLSFIDRLALDSPNMSNQSLYFDDDLNESNIMEIKTITIITKKKMVIEKKKNTNPFLTDANMDIPDAVGPNPFLLDAKPEIEYNEEMMKTQEVPPDNPIQPRRLVFAGDTSSTISTVNESANSDSNHEYENIDMYRADSPIYENVGDEINDTNYNKQSKILGYDVSQFSAVDIMNLNKKNKHEDCSNDSNDSKKDFKQKILKASNKLSKKVFRTLKKKFKTEKVEPNNTLNPYEVPRKPAPKQKAVSDESGFENPALNLDNSDEIEIEELDDDEHQYETVKTLRNTRLNMNVTPLRERGNENTDTSHNKTYTPGKKVRFDSTLNQEKLITGNSFDHSIQSPGFDSKIDKYHDELENCINEKKFLQQNM